MTFIASVIAKKGVAIIADSLVTSVRPIIEFKSFFDYVQSKNKDNDGKNIQIEYDDVIELFRDHASHTKDYEEKLFKYDNYTAITTAGLAVINDKRIADIISELHEHNNSKANKKSYSAKSLETKVKDFCAHITKEIKHHLGQYPTIANTTFIFTHYIKSTHKTVIYKIEIVEAKKADLENENFEFVKYKIQPEIYKVVCDGQNRISERILFGDRNTLSTLMTKVATALIKILEVDESKIPADIYKKILDDGNILDSDTLDDMKIFQLSNLSLQQAVDLACLLMRIEMDFQKYTKNIPTVGGVIKLATIGDEGFKFIHGYDIVKPDFI